MASATIEKGRYLFESGNIISELFVILKGSVSVSFPGGEFTLAKGEVPGICELHSDVHLMTCKALEDTSVLSYPISDIAALESFFRKNPDYSILFARSAFRQINASLQCCDSARFNSKELYASCTKDYSLYNACCIRHQVDARQLPAMSELPPFMDVSPLEEWAVSYYDGFEHLLSENSDTPILSKEPAVPTGLIASMCLDFEKVIASLSSSAEYQKQVLSLYLNENGTDLFTLYTSLYEKSDADSSEINLLQASIARMIQCIQSSAFVNQPLYAQRAAALQAVLKSKPAGAAEAEKKNPANDSLVAQLTDSLQTILSYSGADEELCHKFKDTLARYQGMSDKSATDDGARRLRQQLTTLFYELYSLIFFKAAKDPSMPPAVRMFLYFGYVDEVLAGTENAVYLCQLAEQLAGESHPHTFTFYDWLIAILNGQREPSRNEFDEDYSKYLRDMKVTGKITPAEEADLANDTAKKVEFELKNMFPPVNKMTNGRISTFCPVFSAHNVIKPLNTTLVSNDTLQAALNYTISLDFGAYYREYVYTNTKAGIPKEFFHVEILPDFILMPGIGTRGVMWQEIEGRRRSTSARMMLPLFYLDDLRSAVVRLTGEYRWEMCKRVQGARWNDLSERSLTSEYFDYIQFYKKNHELSAETKEKIKTALQKARGNFKEMFIRDYTTYILFEGTGSPRLTKTARTILFTYCPFAKPVRDTLSENPIFKELMDRYGARQKQQLHKMDLLKRKIENTGSEVPKEVQDEWDYLNC